VNIDTIVMQYEGCRVDPIPIMLEAAAWLKSRAPAAPRLCLCKGTNGLGEEIFRDGKLVAMSDWEEVSIGDPAADFAYMQNMAPEISRDGVNLWGLQKALDYYRSISGIAVSLESVSFYGLVRALKLVVLGQSAAASVMRNPDRCEIRQAWTGTEVNHNAQRILGSAMGWMGPVNPVIFDEVHLSVEQLA
jgi:aminoglycoside phosphotransferase (APT) family kinase protein